MTSEWSPTGGWRSYDAWKRWYRHHWGKGQGAAPPLPGQWRGVYRAFSEAEGVQAEVEIVTGERAAPVDAAEVRRRARASLVRFRDHVARDPHRHRNPVVVVQVVVDPHHRLSLSCGEFAAPTAAPRRPLGKLIALALEELGGS